MASDPFTTVQVNNLDLYSQVFALSNAQMQSAASSPIEVVKGIPGRILIPRGLIWEFDTTAAAFAGGPTSMRTRWGAAGAICRSITPNAAIFTSQVKSYGHDFSAATTGSTNSDQIGQSLFYAHGVDIAGGDAANRYVFTLLYHVYSPFLP